MVPRDGIADCPRGSESNGRMVDDADAVAAVSRDGCIEGLLDNVNVN